MFVIFDDFFIKLFWWTQPSRPERPGSFSFERLQKITYTEESKTSRISFPLPALEEEAKRRTEDVGALAEMVTERRTEQKATDRKSVV